MATREVSNQDPNQSSEGLNRLKDQFLCGVFSWLLAGGANSLATSWGLLRLSPVMAVDCPPRRRREEAMMPSMAQASEVTV